MRYVINAKQNVKEKEQFTKLFFSFAQKRAFIGGDERDRVSGTKYRAVNEVSHSFGLHASL
ncbi:MAG: hypothetical protein IKC83_00125 [Clostridia bacterium]|nr:hypothetical protein [Clostridia bacterium]